jgi:hypothetical protein
MINIMLYENGCWLMHTIPHAWNRQLVNAPECVWHLNHLLLVLRVFNLCSCQVDECTFYWVLLFTKNEHIGPSHRLIQKKEGLKDASNNVRFEVLTLVTMKITLIGDVIPCSLALSLAMFQRNVVFPSYVLKMAQCSRWRQQIPLKHW